MIKVQANPLVLAAALGLLGPVALADDDDNLSDGNTIGGVWTRSPDLSNPDLSNPDLSTPSQSVPSSDTAALPARLGPQIQLLPIDDAFIIDDGTEVSCGATHSNGSWNTSNGITQTISCPDGQIRREFHTEGDALTIYTVITHDDAQEISYTDVYTRVMS